MASEKKDALFVEGVDYPVPQKVALPLQKADADADDVCIDDYVTLAAQRAFHITYLFPWQRIVIANILDSAGIAASVATPAQNVLCGMPDGGETACCCTPYADPCTTPARESEFVEEDDASLLQVIAQSAEAVEQTQTSCGDVFCRGKQIVLLPTGAGKSLCFLTPALLLAGPTLVLYPLLALMSDQKRRMDEGGMVSVVFRGQQTVEEREENFSKIHNGARIILANPEVLQNMSLVKRLAECHIAHIAIDEAHCVSEWGDSFRPAYLTLGTIIKQLGVQTVTAFTATASPQVLSRVAEVLFDGDTHIVRSDSDRPNIHYTVINAFAKKREAFRLAVMEQKPLIVFCGTRKHAEDMARELSAYYGADKVKFYHAGLTKEEKATVEKWFYPKTDAILCCTCAFGMGVDKKDIHCVIHLDVPATAEAYIQEAGRGGRDNSVAKGILLWSHTDSLKTESFAQGSRARVLKTFAESKTCRRQVLLDALGGEKAACDGCDVCERHGPAPFAYDAQIVLAFINRHRREFDRDSLYAKLEQNLNNRDLPRFSMKIWEHGDIAEILQQLESAGYIRTCLWPWRDKIDCAWKKDGAVGTVYRSVIWRKLFLVQERALQLQRHLIYLLHCPESFCYHLVQTLWQRFRRLLVSLQQKKK